MNWIKINIIKNLNRTKMYKQNKMSKTTATRNEAIEGETIEQKIERIVNNKEPITDGAPRVYTERKDGVLPAYDIRTDRFEIAVEAMDKVTGSHQAKREERAKMKAEEGGKGKNEDAKEGKNESKNDQNQGGKESGA